MDRRDYRYYKYVRTANPSMRAIDVIDYLRRYMGVCDKHTENTKE